MDQDTTDAPGEGLRLLTIPEVARRLGVSRNTAYRMRAEGDWPQTINIARAGTGYQRLRVSTTALAEFIAARSATTGGAP